MSAEQIEGRDKAIFVRNLIEQTVQNLEKVISPPSMPLPEGCPPSSVVARGLIVNQLMMWTRQEYGAAGVAFLEEMYRDFLEMDEAS